MAARDILLEAELLDTPGEGRLRLRFRGPFEGRTVTWDATLIALAGPDAPEPDGTQGGNFIEIGSEGPDNIPIRVGLQVERIDLPTVRKAMIMIRCYKRLRRGRHDYGATPAS